MKKFNLHIISRILFISLAISLITYLFFRNLVPLGVSAKLATDNGQLITLNPPDRVKRSISVNGDTQTAILNDLIYFSTNMDFKYDRAKIRVIFKNQSEAQPFHMGFQDEDKWHFNTQLIDMPLLNNIQKMGWTVLGTNPSLYQKTEKYSSFQDLLSSQPSHKLGIVNYDENVFRQYSLSDYKTSDKETIFNLPLRGRVIFFSYLDNEIFKLRVEKQDLNIYEDPDVVTINIYKENDVVYSAQIDDDGISDSSGKVVSPSAVTIQNPGPGLPEPGIYKVVIDASNDTVITQIVTNLNRIVFASPIYPVSNQEVYPKIVQKTSPSILYSDASEFNFETYHEGGEQEVRVGTQSGLLKIKEELIATPSAEVTTDNNLTAIILPKSDVVVKGKLGYFAFSPEQFFQPTRYKLLNIDSKEDLEGVDYIIADYKPSWQEGEWRVAEAEFDLRTAFVKNGKLSWLIKAPGLKENGREVIIKKIEVELTKKPLIKF